MTKPYLTRRSFLATSAAAVAMAATPGWARAEAGPDRWEVLKRITSDKLLRPNDAGYAKAARPNNLRFNDVRPQGVAYVTSPQMIADVISWCRDYDMPFVVRGGGHNYAGFSTSHDLVIDMREMGRLSFDDTSSGAVTIGAGAINGQIYSALNKAGRIMTHGRCPTVGAAGFLLGGGIGFNMRRFGMACDAVTTSEIVTAEGKILTLSANENEDLFWATRGGAGGNFGVSTKFTLQTQPVDNSITVFRIVWRANTLEVAKALFAAADAAPESLATRINLGGVTPELGANGRQVPVTLLGQFAGPEAELRAILAPVYAAAAPEHEDIQHVSYWDGQNFLMEPGAPDYFRERSAYLQTAPSHEFLGQAFERLAKWTGTGAAGNLFFFQTGGKINEVASDATAYVHRNSRWLSVVGIVWTEDDVAQPEKLRNASDWQDSFYQDVNRLGGTGAYQNFPDNALVDWRAAYYGENYAKLLQVKEKYDPTNVFSYAQAI
jgi:FAD/FMN-containing dehydrogenase